VWQEEDVCTRCLYTICRGLFARFYCHIINFVALIKKSGLLQNWYSPVLYTTSALLYHKYVQ